MQTRQGGQGPLSVTDCTDQAVAAVVGDSCRPACMLRFVQTPLRHAHTLHDCKPLLAAPSSLSPQEFELDLDIKEGAASDDEQPEQMDQD